MLLFWDVVAPLEYVAAILALPLTFGKQTTSDDLSDGRDTV
jgi:hypothetical protein